MINGINQKVIKKFFDYCYYLFPTLWLIVLLLAYLKVFYALEILNLNSFLKPELFFILTILLGIAGLFVKSKKNFFLYRSVFVLSLITVMVSGFLLLFFTYLDGTIWPGFALYKFNARPPFVLWVFILSAFFSLLKMVSEVEKLNPFSKILFILMAGVLLSNFFKIYVLFIREAKYMFEHPRASYEDRIKFKVGDFFYDYIKFIKSNTPEDAKILIPPSSSYPWPQTGNGQYMGYFLYPRQVLSGNEKDPGYDLSLEKFDFVLIAWGESSLTTKGYTHGFPKFEVLAEKIIYFERDGSTKEVLKNYRYENLQENSWGIIKIRKENK